MKKRFAPIILIISVLLLAGCGTRDLYGSEDESLVTPAVTTTATADDTTAASDSATPPEDTDSSEGSDAPQNTTPLPETEKTDSPAVTTVPPEEQTGKSTAKTTAVTKVTKPPVQTTPPPVTTNKINADEKIGFQFKFNTSWQNNWGRDTYQYTIILANYTNQDITDWTVNIPVPNDSRITGFWGGTFHEDAISTNGVITVTPNKNYGGSIPAKSTIEIGFQIKLDNELTTLRQATLEAGGLTVNSKNRITMP